MSYKKYLEAGTSLNKYSRQRLKKNREDEDSEDDDIEDEDKTSSDTLGVEFDSDIGEADAGERYASLESEYESYDEETDVDTDTELDGSESDDECNSSVFGEDDGCSDS